MSTASDILVGPDADRGLYFTIFISGCIHLGVLGLLLFAHPKFLERPKMESYTVDLVSPSTLGGTNLHPGGAAPKPQPAKAAPAVQLPAPAPPKPAPPAESKAPQIPPPPVEKVEPKPPPPPKPAEAKPVEAKPEPKPEVVAAKPEPKVEPKPPPKPEVAAKPKPPEPPKPKQPEKAAKPEPPKPAPEPKKEVAKAERPAAEPSKDRDRQIADAVNRRANQIRNSESAAAKSLDNKIEAAVQRRVREVGTGTEAGSGSGPISFGPGSGAGGIVKGVEYILYRNQMEARIKAAWAWAGANRALKAMVRFNILPSGEIANVQVIEPSGDSAYDLSIERALKAVSPLDPPPEKYREEFSTVELEFRPEDIQS